MKERVQVFDTGSIKGSLGNAGGAAVDTRERDLREDPPEERVTATFATNPQYTVQFGIRPGE